MSEITSQDITKQDQSRSSNPIKQNKKIRNRNDQYPMILNQKTLASQLMKKTDALIIKLNGDSKNTSDETLKIIAKQIKSLKKLRKLDLQCQL